VDFKKALVLAHPRLLAGAFRLTIPSRPETAARGTRKALYRTSRLRTDRTRRHRRKRRAFAVRLLAPVQSGLGTDRPVAIVGAAVGIDDPFYFARWFARATATMPSEYRRTLSRGPASPLAGLPWRSASEYTGSRLPQRRRFIAPNDDKRSTPAPYRPSTSAGVERVFE
jgi:hypothetical protein